jgi:hypothetical protein
MTDLIFYDHGSIVLMLPATEAAAKKAGAQPAPAPVTEEETEETIDMNTFYATTHEGWYAVKCRADPTMASVDDPVVLSPVLYMNIALDAAEALNKALPATPVERMPQADEVWLTACGAKVATTGRTTLDGGGWSCLVLSPGFGWTAGTNFVVNDGGRYVRLDYGVEHPLDLVAFITRF